MRILFMGTPDIASGCLEHLYNEGFEIVGAVCREDKPKGRGHKMMAPPVKMFAQGKNIPVYQPNTFKDNAFLPVLEETKPDIIVVVAYGKILPKYVLDYPKYGCINMHASKLPKYRGAAPIQWAIINGETETAATVMKMDEGLDTGDILVERIIKIGEYETAGELFDRMMCEGAQALCETIKNIDKIKAKKQEGNPVYAPMITRETAHIDWKDDCGKICRLICGMNPAPIAYTYYKGEAVKILSAKKSEEQGGVPGEIIRVGKDGMLVSAGSGAVLIKTVRFPGKKTMEIGEYIRGNSIETGEVLS